MDDLDGKLMDERTCLADLLRGLGNELDGLALERCSDLLPQVAGSGDELVAYVRALGVSVWTPYRESHDLTCQATGAFDRRWIMREDATP